MASFSCYLQGVPGQKPLCNSCCPARTIIPVGISVSLQCYMKRIRKAPNKALPTGTTKKKKKKTIGT